MSKILLETGNSVLDVDFRCKRLGRGKLSHGVASSTFPWRHDQHANYVPERHTELREDLTAILHLTTQSHLTHTVPSGSSLSNSKPRSLAKADAVFGGSQMTCVIAVSGCRTTTPASPAICIQYKRLATSIRSKDQVLQLTTPHLVLCLLS